MLRSDEAADLRLLRRQPRVICSVHIVALARVGQGFPGVAGVTTCSSEGQPRRRRNGYPEPICFGHAKGFTIYHLALDALRFCRTRSHT
jgi:hypothetical protein